MQKDSTQLHIAVLTHTCCGSTSWIFALFYNILLFPNSNVQMVIIVSPVALSTRCDFFFFLNVKHFKRCSRFTQLCGRESQSKNNLFYCIPAKHDVYKSALKQYTDWALLCCPMPLIKIRISAQKSSFFIYFIFHFISSFFPSFRMKWYYILEVPRPKWFFPHNEIILIGCINGWPFPFHPVFCVLFSFR